MGNKFARSHDPDPDAVLGGPRIPGRHWSKIPEDPEVPRVTQDAPKVSQDAHKDAPKVSEQDVHKDTHKVSQDASKAQDPQVQSTNIALKCVTLLGILMLLMFLFFFLVVLVDRKPKLPHISLNNATILSFETDESASVLNINMSFNMQATSDYKLRFHFPSGRLFLAYKFTDTQAYNIGPVITPDFSIVNRTQPFVAQCNQPLVGIPQDVLLQFRNDVASGTQTRTFMHGVLITTYTASKLVSNYPRRLHLCYNLTIVYPPPVDCSTPPCPRSNPVLAKVTTPHCNPGGDDNSNVSRF